MNTSSLKSLAIILSVSTGVISTACNKQFVASDTAGCCQATNSKTALTCKLMPEELRLRKETVLKSLKEKVLEKKELKDGYAFRFAGTDENLEELMSFIKAERECCDFFIFNLSISGDKSEVWLALTGVEGAKDFVTEELGL